LTPGRLGHEEEGQATQSMTGSKIRFGIVGTGGIANTHAAGLAALGEDTQIVACCDIAADFAEKWGPIFTPTSCATSSARFETNAHQR
jgi:predicted dehydrogenase